MSLWHWGGDGRYSVLLTLPGKAGSRHGGVVKSGVHAGLSSRRSRVQISSSPPEALIRQGFVVR